jgi:hypothetical protein
MKRDFNKIRNILLKFDESEFTEVVQVLAEDDMSHYFHLMYEGNLIKFFGKSGKPHTYQLELLPEGKIFLELCRNQIIWDNVNTRIQECGFESVPYEILKEVLYDQIKKELMG